MPLIETGRPAPAGNAGIERRLNPGAVIDGRYRLLERIGRGGMGEVYSAEDLLLEQQVALKRLSPRVGKAPVLEDLLREVRLARRITHPNVCRVYDVVLAEEACFLSMELVDGDDLASVLAAESPLPLERSTAIARQLCLGLAAAHDQEILHRDLKPANVLLDRQGTARITDFSIAVWKDQGLDDTARAGTPFYMAPEQHRGEPATARTDLYSLGLILYELFTGQRAIAADHPDEIAWRHCTVRPVPPAELQPELEADIEHIILRCLEKDPQARPASAREVAWVLGDAAATRHLLLKAVVVGRTAEDAKVATANEGLAGFQGLVRDHLGSRIEGSEAAWAFDRATDAVRFALALRGSRGDPRGESVRLGLHLTEIAHAEELGQHLSSIQEGPSLAARLARIAAPGQILLSRAAFDLARRSTAAGDGELRWLSHGSYELDGLPEPVEIFEVGHRGQAPLVPPPDTADARRLNLQLSIAGWRPAPGLALAERPHWSMDHKLGEGGFGEVWLAVHRKTRERRVFKFCFHTERLRALKREITLFRLLKEELGDRDDITRLLDWNLDRPPYFLELAYTSEGSLAEWADARGGIERIPLNVRLDIVAQVGSALAAAHSVGVLHKDVKPANVLIVDSPQKVRAQLTDFGIGELTDKRRLARAGITSLGLTLTASDQGSQEPGTPLYRAPEMLEGKAATLEADVYALGVMLYQMVVGDLGRPLAPGWQRDVDDPLLRADIAAAVDGQPKRRPEARRFADGLRQLEERRRTAAAAEEARRGTERLAAAVARLQRRRRALLVILGALLVVSAVIGVLALRIAEEARRANREAKTSSQIADFLAETFASPDPFHQGLDDFDPDGLTARELIEHAGARALRELRDAPELQGQLLTIIARTHRRHGDHDAAEQMLQEALTAQQRNLGARHPKTLTTLAELANLQQARGSYSLAERIHRQVLNLRRQTLGESHAEVADSLDRLASVLQDQGRYDAAEPHYREALRLRRRLLGDHHILVADSLNNLAGMLEDRGRDLATVEALYKEALQIYRQQRGELHPYVSTLWNNLATYYHRRGELRRAEILYRRAIEIARYSLGDDHLLVAGHLSNLAGLLESIGQYGEAETILRRVLDLRRLRLGEKHPAVALTVNNLALVLSAKGDLAAAELLHREALELRRRLFGQDHPQSAWTLVHLAKAIYWQERFTEAADLLYQAMASLEEHYGETYPGRQILLGELGATLTDMGRLQAAEHLLRDSMAEEDAHPLVAAMNRVYLGRLLVADERFSEAESMLRDGTTQLDAILPDEHWQIAFARSVLANALLGLGRHLEAAEALAGTCERIRQVKGDAFYHARECALYEAAIRRG